jgi:hypothetical protein
LIHVEQPWLFRFAKRYQKRCATKPVKVLYGSQNLEHVLRFDIVKTYMGLEAAENAKRLVLQCELAAIRQADGICCVSQHDLDWTQCHTNVPCVVASNGVVARVSTEAGVREANKITGHRKFAAYFASAHPPNISGFFNMFGAGAGCIAPNELIVIVGGAGEHISSNQRFARAAGLSRACTFAGTVSEACVQGLLDVAHAIILPIAHGGGTNLKTAEALWAGKHVVATTSAMRGFDQYISSRGVAVADGPPQFLSSLRKAMESPPIILSEAERAARRCVLWTETLKPLLAFIRTL